uniref:Plastidic phosphate translocator1 n=1 Tax=Solanum tuberosum TaxID=4113 RepID=M0ZTA9_SOLTU
AISVGVAIAAYGEAKYDSWGVFLLLLGVLFEATRLVMIQILLTSKVIKDTVTPVNLIGYGLAFLGVAYYNNNKLQAKKSQQADEEARRLLLERDSNDSQA